MLCELPNSNYVSLNMSMAQSFYGCFPSLFATELIQNCKSMAGYSYMAYIVLIYKIGKSFEYKSSCTKMVLCVKKSGHVP